MIPGTTGVGGGVVDVSLRDAPRVHPHQTPAMSVGDDIFGYMVSDTPDGGDDDGQWFRDLRTPRPDRKYFFLKLGANRREKPFWERYTHYVGVSERNPGWEIREASAVEPGWLITLWTETNQSWLVVHNDVALALFYEQGGQALVEQEFAEKRLPEVIGPWECMHDGAIEVGGIGFLATGHLTDEAIEQRLARGRLRMEVIKRDDYRCVICGRRATHHIDLELHAHHLIPWRMHGPTAEENLVTLCGTCHKGLAPDYEPMLRKLAGLPGPARPLRGRTQEFEEEVTRYREWVARRVSEHASRDD